MVNVDKNIVPGKPVESPAKSKAPARRPRNQELNSSRKPIDVRRASKGRQPFGTNLDSSKKLNCSLADSQLSLKALTEILQNLFPGYSNEESKQMMRERYNTAKQNYPEYDEPTLLKQMLWDYFGLTEDALSEISDVTDVETMKRLSDDANLWSDDPNFVDNYGEAMNSSKALNCSSEEPEGDSDGGESVAEGVDASDIKITTESGNEVSMQDIKIVQNPDTNELAIFIPEDEDETIPEGFSVIGMVVPDTLGSAPAIEGGDVCPECGQDPCVCEEGSEDGGELDSSEKKSELNCSSSSGLLEVATEYYEDEHNALVDILQSVDNLGYGDAVYEQLIKNYGYEGTDAQQADEALIKMASEDADEHDFLVSLIQAIEDLGYGKQVYTDVLGIGGDINSSVNSSLGGGDDRQDATSQVTVPKSFPDDKVHDLYRWIETELMHEGIDVDVYGVGRPSAGVISFEFEVTGRDPAEVDAIIEDRVQEFVQNGYEGLQYPKGDPRHGLNSEKHEKNLNCKVENARVEPTEQGTWVVKADTDRFGKNAILYEHYSEEGANKYLDRLKAGGDAVANGYSGHIDPKKVDLDKA